MSSIIYGFVLGDYWGWQCIDNPIYFEGYDDVLFSEFLRCELDASIISALIV
jgi:hypothetical protein